jgi:hypothetical protein
VAPAGAASELAGRAISRSLRRHFAIAAIAAAGASLWLRSQLLLPAAATMPWLSFQLRSQGFVRPCSTEAAGGNGFLYSAWKISSVFVCYFWISRTKLALLFFRDSIPKHFFVADEAVFACFFWFHTALLVSSFRTERELYRSKCAGRPCFQSF